MGKSKFEVMENAIQQQISTSNRGIDDNVKQQRLERELAKIDNEVEREIANIESTPIDKQMLKDEATNLFKNQKKANERERDRQIEEVGFQIKTLKLNIEQATIELAKRESRLINVKEEAMIVEEDNNLLAKKEFNRTLSSIDNTQQTIDNLKEKAKLKGEQRKEEVEMSLAEIKAKNKAQEDILALYRQIYNDVHDIGIKSAQDTK